MGIYKRKKKHTDETKKINSERIVRTTEPTVSKHTKRYRPARSLTTGARTTTYGRPPLFSLPVIIPFPFPSVKIVHELRIVRNTNVETSMPRVFRRVYGTVDDQIRVGFFEMSLLTGFSESDHRTCTFNSPGAVVWNGILCDDTENPRERSKDRIPFPLPFWRPTVRGFRAGERNAPPGDHCLNTTYVMTDYVGGGPSLLKTFADGRRISPCSLLPPLTRVILLYFD